MLFLVRDAVSPSFRAFRFRLCLYRFRKAPSAARGWRFFFIAVGLLGGEGLGEGGEGATLEEPPPGQVAIGDHF